MASSSVAKLKIQIQADLANAKAAMQQLSNSVDELDPAAQKASKSLSNISTVGEQTKGVVLGLAAAFLSFKTAAALGRIADDYGQMASRLRMVTASSEEYALVQQRIAETADRTYKPLAAQQELFIKSANSMKEMGYATNQTLDFLDSVSSSLTINSASAEQFARANDAIGKAMTNGKFSAIEWKAVLDTMPTAIGDIADYLGKAESEVKKLASEGKLSMQTFADGMIAAQKKNAELAENMPTTIGDAVTKVGNHLSSYIGEVNEAIGATSAISDMVGSLANIFNTEFTADTIVFFSNLSAVFIDITDSLTKIGAQLEKATADFKLFGDQASNSIVTLDTNISNVPNNIKALIQLATVEIATFIEQTKARVISLANAVAALPKGVNAVKAAYAEGTKEIERLEEARLQSIQTILAERDATIAASVLMNQ